MFYLFFYQSYTLTIYIRLLYIKKLEWKHNGKENKEVSKAAKTNLLEFYTQLFYYSLDHEARQADGVLNSLKKFQFFYAY